MTEQNAGKLPGFLPNSLLQPYKLLQLLLLHSIFPVTMVESTTFDPYPFGEGRFRLAYKGTVTAPPSLAGQKCVIKKSKESYTWNKTGWNMAIEIHGKAKAIADSYNKVHNCTLSIRYVDLTVHQVVTKSDNQCGPLLNEYVLVEDFIPGAFTKWCNNYGFIATTSDLMPAFMHWSWVHSHGQWMIADLQGVRTSTEYCLTDPVIMSNSLTGGQYGCTDTGVEGIAMFFLKHECNQFCDAYPKPTITDVLTTDEAKLQIESLSTSTAYSHELKIPAYLKGRMINLFPSIAAR